MISNDYRDAADFVAGFAVRQQAMAPDAAAKLAKRLMDLASRVQRLESRPKEREPLDAC